MKQIFPRQLIIKRVRDEARDTRSFDMLPAGGDDQGLDFKPGQVALLRAGDERPAYFAFASAPEDEEVEFLIKRGGGAGGLIYEMAEGSQVELTGIVGSGFALHEQQGKDLVFVAMGTGVAPLRSALRHAIRHAADYGQLVVLYGARTPHDFCYSDEVDDWEAAGVELRRVISRPDGHDWSGPTGYVQSLLDHVLPDLRSPVALICGSQEMIGQTRDRLQQMGFAPEAILTNY
jgi:sulfhydrogenase subunit gamma (sulfur reductase)